MADLSGIPYFELEFDKNAQPVKPQQQQDIIDAVKRADGPKELIVFSHGWNNDMDDARGMYTEFFANFAADMATDGSISKRRFGIVGVLWPSKKFADSELIPGGAASAGNDVAADKVLLQQLDILAAVTGKDLSALRALVPQLNTKAEARRKFSTDVLALLPVDVSAEDQNKARIAKAPTQIADDSFLRNLGTPTVAAPTGQGGGATSIGGSAPAPFGGGAAGLGDMFSGIKAGAMNLLNLATYYQMKNRAGEVGEKGLNPALRAIRKAVPTVGIHLIGHSFGGRVITAAAAGSETDPPLAVDSMSLLQAAFSHYAFAEKWDGTNNGVFRRVVERAGTYLRGPMIVSHSRADKAVGTAYAIASRIARQNASGVGDANDPFGGLGGNGALKTPEHLDVKINKNGEPYSFQRSKVYNIDGNGVIGSHSDIRRAEVAHAVADNIRAAGTP